MKINRMYYLSALAISLSAVPAHSAEPKVGYAPAIGEERTATAGSPIYERYTYMPMKGAVIKESMVGKGEVILPTDPLQVVYASGKFKACMMERGYPIGACGVDEDRDGKFDRISIGNSSAPLPQPVAYEEKEVPNPVGMHRWIISYKGSTSEALQLSFRTVFNGYLRPAESEELSLPLSKTFPQQVAFKFIKMTILSIDGMGMRYRIDQ